MILPLACDSSKKHNESCSRTLVPRAADAGRYGANMINAWFQKPDYSVDDYENVSCAQVLEIWNSLNIGDLDNDQSSLEERNVDFCPWGIGIGHNTDKSIHVYRESIKENTFGVLKQTTTPKKILGFIPSKSNKSEEMDGIPCSQVPSLIKDYFNNIEKP
jgi:hypothetical protein